MIKIRVIYLSQKREAAFDIHVIDIKAAEHLEVRFVSPPGDRDCKCVKRSVIGECLMVIFGLGV